MDNSNRRIEIKNILSGKLNPIDVAINLNKGETAYYQFKTTRMADRVNAVSYTVGKTKKKNVVMRSLIGNLLFGRAGAVIGGLSGEEEIKSATHSVDKNEVVDQGVMILTNKRILFSGKQVISIPYSEILSIHFPHFAAMEIQYPAKAKGEAYSTQDKEPALYYKGIMRLLGTDKSSVKDIDVEQFMVTDRTLTKYNDDGSINCPSCNTVIKDYKKRRDLFTTTKVYTCPSCGMVLLK